MASDYFSRPQYLGGFLGVPSVERFRVRALEVWPGGGGVLGPDTGGGW